MNDAGASARCSRSGRFALWTQFMLLAAVALGSACQSDLKASGPANRAIEQVAWDAAQVTRLTRRLADQMSALRQAVRLDPIVQERLRYGGKSAIRLRDQLSVLEKSTGQLARKVAGGGGLEETASIVRKIGSVLRTARVQARTLRLGQPALERVEQARETLKALSPFYGTNLDPADSAA